MPGHGAVLGLGRALADVQRGPQLALAVVARVAPGASGGVAAAQIAGELLAQRTPGLHEQRQVDRLVRHPHLRIVGERPRQPPCDLLG